MYGGLSGLSKLRARENAGPFLVYSRTPGLPLFTRFFVLHGLFHRLTTIRQERTGGNQRLDGACCGNGDLLGAYRSGTAALVAPAIRGGVFGCALLRVRGVSLTRESAPKA